MAFASIKVTLGKDLTEIQDIWQAISIQHLEKIVNFVGPISSLAPWWFSNNRLILVLSDSSFRYRVEIVILEEYLLSIMFWTKCPRQTICPNCVISTEI